MDRDTVIEEQIQRYIDGTATPDELHELKAAVVDDPEVARRLVRASILHQLLEEHYGEEMIGSGMEESLFPEAAADTLEILESRVERNRSGHRLLRFALPMAALLMLMFSAFWIQREGATATITSCDPGLIVRRDGKHLNAEEQFQLRAGDRLVIPRHLQAAFKFEDDTRIALRGFAEIELNRLGNRKRFTVRQGYLHADVAPQPREKPMTIFTPHGEVTVLGTRFLLNVADRDSRLEVESGHVRIRQKELVQDVYPNEIALTRDGVLQRTVFMKPERDRNTREKILFEETFASPVHPAWKGGMYYAHNLPEDSPGAFRGCPQPAAHSVCHIRRWFNIQHNPIELAPDTLIKLRYRASRPGWVTLSLRVPSMDQSHWLDLLYDVEVAGDRQWEEVMVPLKAFQVKISGDKRQLSTLFPRDRHWEGAPCNTIAIQSEKSTDLIVDRVQLVRR